MTVPFVSVTEIVKVHLNLWIRSVILTRWLLVILKNVQVTQTFTATVYIEMVSPYAKLSTAELW